MRRFLSVFAILIVTGVAEAQKRAGTYELHPNQTVVITDATGSIKFDFAAASGEDEFTLQGTAKLVGKNTFEYRKVSRGKIENSVCRIRFIFSGKFVLIKEDPECADDRFPVVPLDGKYEKLAP